MDWIQKSKEAPKTVIDEDIKQKVIQFMAEGIGASNSLLSHISYIPAERQQGNCGNCWNWAGTGVMEVALDVQGVAKNRLSTQYLNSCKTDQFACCGGWLSTYANWYAQSAQKKAIPWSNTNASYADANADCRNASSARSCGSISTTPNYPINAITMETVPVVAGNQVQTIANIKSVIDGIPNRAIWFGFFLPNQTSWDNFFNFWNNQNESAVFNMSGYCGQTYDQNGGGHAVVLVGYNDSVAEPYWEFLNSWGTANGNRPNGLFRIRMNMNYDCQYNFSSGPDDAFYWQTLNVQFQGTPTQCTYSISPQSEYVSASGGTRTVNVTASLGSCTWTASESLGWVTLNNSSGTGNGSVSYTVAANSGPQRSGTIIIAGQTYTVTQEGTGGTGSPIF